RFLGYSNRSQIKGKSIEQEQVSGHVRANAGNGTDGNERCKIADDSGQSADDSALSAIVAIVVVERVSDEAAIAGLIALPTAEQADLTLELPCRRGDQRNSERVGYVRNYQSRGEIVAALADGLVPL